MSTSLNGWTGIPLANSKFLATGIVPGTGKHVTLEKEVLPLFLCYLADWHHHVMPIDVKGALGPDGWEYRAARGSANLSNHASGTAVDVRYDVLKANHKRNMTPTQITAVHKLLDKYVTSTGKRIFGWGGDWTVGTYCDEMHTEIIQSFSPGSHGTNGSRADVHNVITRLRINPQGYQH